MLFHAYVIVEQISVIAVVLSLCVRPNSFRFFTFVADCLERVGGHKSRAAPLGGAYLRKRLDRFVRWFCHGLVLSVGGDTHPMKEGVEG